MKIKMTETRKSLKENFSGISKGAYDELINNLAEIVSIDAKEQRGLQPETIDNVVDSHLTSYEDIALSLFGTGLLMKALSSVQDEWYDALYNDILEALDKYISDEEQAEWMSELI